MARRREMIDTFMKELRESGNQFYKSVFNGRTIGVMAIVDCYEDGPLLAYASGMPHRVSKKNHTWNLVHGPLSVVSNGTPYNNEQSHSIPDSNIMSIEYDYLGESTYPLFGGASVDYGFQALFLYPENTLVAKDLVRFVNEVCKTLPLETEVLIITKSPVILTDFPQEAVRAIRRNSM